MIIFYAIGNKPLCVLYPYIDLAYFPVIIEAIPSFLSLRIKPYFTFSNQFQPLMIHGEEP